MATFRMDYPPSVNTYWRSFRGHTVLSAKGRAYRTAAMGLTDERFDDHVQVSLGITFPDRRKRDLDNVLKAVLDAIDHAGVYEDDSQVKAIYVFWTGLIEPPGCVDVTIDTWRSSDGISVLGSN